MFGLSGYGAQRRVVDKALLEGLGKEYKLGWTRVPCAGLVGPLTAVYGGLYVRTVYLCSHSRLGRLLGMCDLKRGGFVVLPEIEDHNLYLSIEVVQPVMVVGDGHALAQRVSEILSRLGLAPRVCGEQGGGK